MPAACSAGQNRLPRTGEVRVDGRGPQAWIDADEQQTDALVDEVVDQRAVERFEFGAGEARHQIVEVS